MKSLLIFDESGLLQEDVVAKMSLITKSIFIDEGQEDSMVNLKITDIDEITYLNNTYRAKNKSTGHWKPTDRLFGNHYKPSETM